MRALATGQWSTQQILDVLTAGHGRYSCRFEILDMTLAKVGDLENVTGARVVQDSEANVKQQLELELLPDSRLVNMSFRYYVKAYFRVGMPNQTEIEYPLGVYLWSQPERSLDSTGLETWKVTLGDRSHLLDLGGPRPDGYTIRAGARLTFEIRRILTTMGMDPSGVVNSPETTAVKLLFDQRANVENQKLVGVKADADPVTWLRILHRLTDALGYYSIYFDGDGKPIVKPAPDLAKAVADVTYETSAASILVGPLETSRDVDQVANRVTIRNHAPGGTVQVVTVDANKVAPTHPLAQKQIGFYIDISYDEPLAVTEAALRARATKALHRRLSCLATVRVKTLAYPVHESFDVVGLQWDGDADYGIGQIHHEKDWSLNLFTGEMQHTLRRLVQAV